MPLLGDWQSQSFYPLTWLYALFSPEGTLRAYGYQVLLHLLIGGAGTWHWLRGRGRSPGACLLGSLIVVLNGKWIAHILVAQQPILGWAWLPWTMASLDRLQRRPSVRETAILSLLLSLLVQGLLPAFIALCAYFLFVYGGILWITAPRRAPLLAALLATCAWTLVINAVALWPATELIRMCTRGAGLTLAEASQGEIPWNVLPFLPVWSTPPLQVGWEMTLYCGVIPCALAIMALSHNRKGWNLVWAGVAVGVLMISMGRQTPLFSLLYHYLPGFSLFRHPARYGLLLSLPIAYLATQQLDRPRPIRPSVFVLGIGLGLIMALVGQHTFGRTEGWLCLMWLGLLGLSLVVPPRIRVSVLVGLTGIELGWFVLQQVDPRPFEQVLGQHRLAAELSRPLGASRSLIVAPQMLTFPYATLNGVESSNGYTALIPKVTLDYVREGIAELPPEHLGVLNAIPPFEPRSIPFLRRGGMASVVSDKPLSLDSDPEWSVERCQPFTSYDFLAPQGYVQHPSLFIYRDSQPLPRHRLVAQGLACSSQAEAVTRARQSDPESTVVLEVPEARPASPQTTAVACHYESYCTRQLEVDVSQPPGAYLFLSEMYYPGWRLHEGTQELPLCRADGYFLAAYLPAGLHHLQLDYSPTSFPWAFGCSGVGLLLAVGALFVGRKGAQTGRLDGDKREG